MSTDWTSKRVVIVYGGAGSEREISLLTGEAFARALRSQGVEPILVDLVPAKVEQLVAADADVVLNALHGLHGEDGTLQGLLELLGVPYTGSGVQASAFAIDKIRSKCVFEQSGVRTPVWCVVGADDVVTVPLPHVVKPSLEGSSVGINIVREASDWPIALAEARACRGEVLVEEFIEGRELSVGVFDDEIMGVIEITSADGWYDYEAKYVRNDTVYRPLTDVSPDVMSEIHGQARRAYDCLGCRGVARVDMMLRDGTIPYVLEVNTVPGMTATSLVPKLAAANGVPFEQFVIALLESAQTDRGSND